MRGQYAQPSSRLGGALLLGAIAAAVIVAVILHHRSGGGSSHDATTAGSASAGNDLDGAESHVDGRRRPDRRQAAHPHLARPRSKAVGVVEILSEGGKHAFYLAAEHLPPSNGFFYAVWLYNSPTSHEALEQEPSGRLQRPPAGRRAAARQRRRIPPMLLTRETSERPSHPGPVVLSGPFSLG